MKQSKITITVNPTTGMFYVVRGHQTLWSDNHLNVLQLRVLDRGYSVISYSPTVSLYLQACIALQAFLVSQ